MIFSKWLNEVKKVASIHPDMDKWLLSIDGLAKDLADLEKAKKKAKNKMDLIGSINLSQKDKSSDKEDEKEDNSSKEKEKTSKEKEDLSKDVLARKPLNKSDVVQKVEKIKQSLKTSIERSKNAQIKTKSRNIK